MFLIKIKIHIIINIIGVLYLYLGFAKTNTTTLQAITKAKTMTDKTKTLMEIIKAINPINELNIEVFINLALDLPSRK